MKIINIFIIVAVYVSFVLLCIAYDIAFSESTIDWIFLEIILGFYLYLGYLLLSIICGRPKNQMQYFQGNMLHRKKQQVHNSEIYEY
jgi:5-bromo-4-chloroindolyl phosphate hydrolysis protein